MLSPRTLALQVAAAGALLVGGLAGAQAAPLPPVAAVAPVQSEGLTTTVQWYGHGYYGPRRHYWGPRRYWGPGPYWGDPRCRVVRRWDPYWGGWRVVRRCW